MEKSEERALENAVSKVNYVLSGVSIQRMSVRSRLNSKNRIDLAFE